MTPRVLRLEFETAKQLRATSGVLGLALLGGAASFIAMLLLRTMVVGIQFWLLLPQESTHTPFGSTFGCTDEPRELAASCCAGHLVLLH